MAKTEGKVKRGRPTEFTEETRKKILDALRLGNYREPSAQYAGVAYRTFMDWMSKGKKDGEGIYFEFSQAVIEAENRAEILAVTAVRKAGQADAKHYHWWLERKAPQRWGRNRLEIEMLQKQVDKLSALVESLIANSTPKTDKPTVEES